MTQESSGQRIDESLLTDDFLDDLNFSVSPEQDVAPAQTLLQPPTVNEKAVFVRSIQQVPRPGAKPKMIVLTGGTILCKMEKDLERGAKNTWSESGYVPQLGRNVGNRASRLFTNRANKLFFQLEQRVATALLQTKVRRIAIGQNVIVDYIQYKFSKKDLVLFSIEFDNEHQRLIIERYRFKDGSMLDYQEQSLHPEQLHNVFIGQLKRDKKSHTFSEFYFCSSELTDEQFTLLASQAEYVNPYQRIRTSPVALSIETPSKPYIIPISAVGASFAIYFFLLQYGQSGLDDAKRQYDVAYQTINNVMDQGKRPIDLLHQRQMFLEQTNQAGTPISDKTKLILGALTSMRDTYRDYSPALERLDYDQNRQIKMAGTNNTFEFAITLSYVADSTKSSLEQLNIIADALASLMGVNLTTVNSATRRDINGLVGYQITLYGNFQEGAGV